MRKVLSLALVTVALVSGCFPIELDVSKDGKILIPRQEGFFIFDPAGGKVQKVFGSERGKPVFARFVPNAKEILIVNEAADGGNEFQFAIVPIGGGKTTEIYTGRQTAYCLFSPDGNNLAVLRVSDKEDPEMKRELPELVLVQTRDGANKVLAKNLGVFVRWFADNKRLLILELKKKTENDDYIGIVAILDTTTGKSTPLATVATKQQFYFDLSPDNKKVLFTALRADKPGAKLDQGKEYNARLFEIETTGAGLRKVDKEARYAIYSPSGKQVLLGTPADGFSFTSLKLEIADAGLTKFTTLTQDAHSPMTVGGEGMTYPGWVDDKTVFYFVERRVYGREGKSLALMMIGADGKNKKCVQPLIDIEAIKGE